MIISSAGAEGISLKCVRQVHILEPYWNYVRLDQVLGRAIRMRSHQDLEKKEQNVEQYLYLSSLPLGTTIESVYEAIEGSEIWDIPKWSGSIKDELAKEKNKSYRDMIDAIIRINVDTMSVTADQYLFNIMEKKYKVSKEINLIIKESSLDCIQHTRDDPELNEKCIRFSDKLKSEIAYFPGMEAHVLDITDTIQLKAKYLYHLIPNIYVISAEDTEEQSIYIYYRVNKIKEDETVDVRYIREYGERLCDIYLDKMIAFNYVEKEYELNNIFNKQFSVYQEIYEIHEDILNDYIQEGTFPSLK